MASKEMCARLREYQRGYRDGWEGRPYDDGSRSRATFIRLGLGDRPSVMATYYWQGYMDGWRDRRWRGSQAAPCRPRTPAA